VTKAQICDILEKAGLFGRGLDYSEYIRIPCPFRLWNHGKEQRSEGKNCYWVEIETTRCGCYVCGDSSNLWGVLAFRAMLDDRPYLWELADQVLDQSFLSPSYQCHQNHSLNLWSSLPFFPLFLYHDVENLEL